MIKHCSLCRKKADIYQYIKFLDRNVCYDCSLDLVHLLRDRLELNKLLEYLDKAIKNKRLREDD